MTRQLRCITVATIAALVLVPAIAAAQHEHHMPTGPMPDTDMHTDTTGTDVHGAIPDPLGIPMTRMGSGTSWLPDSSPMYAGHLMAAGWELMLHGSAFVQYD